jgi:hypothetical protein
MQTNTKNKSLQQKPSRGRLFSSLRKLLLRLLLAVVILYALSFVIVAPLAKWQLAKITGGAVYVHSGHLSDFGSIRLKGLIIAPDEQSFTSDPVLRADNVTVRINLNSLLRGHFSLSVIRLEDFLFSADWNHDAWNFLSLTAAKESSAIPTRLPLVELSGGAVRIRRRSSQNGFDDIAMIGLKGQITMGQNRGEYCFNIASDGRFGYEGTMLEGKLTLGGKDEKNHLSAAGTLLMPQAKIFENAWNLKNIAMDCSFDNERIDVHRLSFDAGKGFVNVTGSFQPGDKEMTLQLDAADINLSDRYAPDTLVYSEPVLHLLDPGLGKFLRRFRPSGTGGAHLKLQGRLDDLSAATLDGSLICTDIAVVDEMFPYRLEHIQGDITLSGRNLRMNHLNANHRQAAFVIEGAIENIGSQATLDFSLKSPGLPLDEDLFTALDQKTKKIWFAFAPSGRMGLDYHYQRSADKEQALTITLELASVSAVYQHFPYPLEHLQGTVVVTPESITFERVVSESDSGRTVSLSGQITNLKNDVPAFHVALEGRKIPIEPNLILAMPAEQRAYLDLVDIKAQVDVDLEISSGPSNQDLPEFKGTVQLIGEKLQASQFPLLLTDVQLSADIATGRIDLYRFEAQVNGGRMAISGQFLKEGKTPGQKAICLDVELNNFNLDKAFWEAAEPEARRLLGDFRMEGPVNVKGHLEKNVPDTTCAPTWLSLDCRGNHLSWKGQELGQAAGRVHLKADEVVFEGFEINLPEMETLPPEIFSQRLLSFYTWAKPAGSMHLVVDKGLLQVSKRNVTNADLTGRVIVNGLSCGQLKEIQNVTGTISGQFTGGISNKQWQIQQLTADYDIEQLVFDRCRLTAIQGTADYDSQTGICRSRNFTGELYGGRLNASWELGLQTSPAYQLSMTVTGLDVSQILSPMTDSSPEHSTHGLAEAKLELEGAIREAAEPAGRLDVKITDMRLGRQSILGKMLTAVQLKEPRSYIFNGIEMNAAVQGKQLFCERIRITGEPLIFYGSGNLDLAQQQMDFELVGINQIFGNDDAIINMLARGFGSAIWKIQVKGTIKDPVIDTVYLSVLKQPLELFKRKEPLP